MNELGTDSDLPVGTRDAVHVPFVVAIVDHKLNVGIRLSIQPGQWVRFTDEKFTKVEPCEKEDAHGIIDPFIDEMSLYNVRVLLRPGITSPVRHEFEIDPSRLQLERAMLAAEVEERKRNDPGCAECWRIQNRRVIRM
jgi:hypothetical protein